MNDGLSTPPITTSAAGSSGEPFTHGDHGHAKPTHQRLVLTDPAAFRYLEEDPSTTVLERRRRLQGYELYFVEQWGCSRKHPTFVITTYTGLEQHSVVVGVLSIPTDQETWSPRLRVYLQAIKKYHARARDTPLGTLMVTNLSNFPSALTVINVPDGDLKKHRETFIVNENLKRLGCTGRAGLNLGAPMSATEAKFRDLYRTNDRVPINASVVELVKLCQAALMLYGKLPMEYADGLLCDVTEQKISDWWADIGGDYFHMDPADGILGPTTVAALLGLLMGARSRLHSWGASVAKDVFDINSTKRALYQFQKALKLERTRRLDRRTLDALHKSTPKAASSESRAVPRVVKSTVAELSGRGAELVNARDKGGIAGVESIEIEDVVALGSGERFKWLWHGKPKKHEDKDLLVTPEDGLVFSDGPVEGLTKKNKQIDDELYPRPMHLSDRVYQASHSSQTSLDHLPPDQALRRAALRNIADKAVESKSGLGKIRSKVRRSHHPNYLKQADLFLEHESFGDQASRETNGADRSLKSDSSVVEKPSQESASQSTSTSQQSSRRHSRSESVDRSRRTSARQKSGQVHQKSKSMYETAAVDDDDSYTQDSVIDLMNQAGGITSRARAHRPTMDRDRTMTAGDMRAIDKMDHFGWAASGGNLLRASKSFSSLLQQRQGSSWNQRFPRRMSFSILESVSVVSAFSQQWAEDGPDSDLSQEKMLALKNEQLEDRLYRLKTQESSWVENAVSQVESINEACTKTRGRMEEVYHQNLNHSHEMQDFVDHLLTSKKSTLDESIKDVETLDAKLEYELQALQSKVEDVESGVNEFERQVVQLEERAAELDGEPVDERSWLRVALGMGVF